MTSFKTKNYRIYPVDFNTLTHIPNYSINISFVRVMKIIMLIIALSIFFSTCYFSFDRGDNIQVWPTLFGGILILVAYIIMRFNEKRPDNSHRIEAAKREAEYLTVEVNLILEKSEEISNNILPFFLNKVQSQILKAKTDLHENAISPFWENIEKLSYTLGLYSEALGQLEINAELYTKYLSWKKHNFPIPFPVNRQVSFPESLLTEYNSIIRKAQTLTSFATVWEIRRNTQVNIAGFRTLTEAVNNMSAVIVAAINNFNDSVKSEFTEFKSSFIKSMNSFSDTQNATRNILGEINEKLYYIEYNKKPNTPFMRPLTDL